MAEDPLFEVCSGFRNCSHGFAGYLTYPPDLTRQQPAMPAGQKVDPKLHPYDPRLTLHAVGIEQYGNFPAIHDVNHRHPFPCKHSRSLCRARWSSTPK